MGLTMTEKRKAVTKAIAIPLQASRQGPVRRGFSTSCARPQGWYRDHARKALRGALRPRVVRPRTPRSPLYGPKVVAVLIFCRDISVNQQRLV
jgi:hypothetical protein